MFWLDFIVEILGLDFLLKYLLNQEQQAIRHTVIEKNKKKPDLSNKEIQYILYLNRIKFKAAFWANFTSNILLSTFIVVVT
jgi:hypothetical protein